MENDFSKSVKPVYTDLDSLFDTRAVLLAALSNQGEYDIKLFGETDISNYFNRVKDNFGTISAWMFHYYYKHRASSLLTHADLTNIPNIIKDYLEASINTATKDTSVKIYVNTAPYSLSTDETSAMFDLLSKVFPTTEIIFIDIPHREIEPKWIKDKDIGFVISYDIADWLGYQIEKNNGMIPELINVAIIAPFILEGVVRSKDITPETVDGLSGVFGLTCDFSFIPASDFCLVQGKA